MDDIRGDGLEVTSQGVIDMGADPLDPDALLMEVEETLERIDQFFDNLEDDTAPFDHNLFVALRIARGSIKLVRALLPGED